MNNMMNNTNLMNENNMNNTMRLNNNVMMNLIMMSNINNMEKNMMNNNNNLNTNLNNNQHNQDDKEEDNSIYVIFENNSSKSHNYLIYIAKQENELVKDVINRYLIKTEQKKEDLFFFLMDIKLMTILELFKS